MGFLLYFKIINNQKGQNLSNENNNNYGLNLRRAPCKKDHRQAKRI
jgi:hypothetical protein